MTLQLDAYAALPDLAALGDLPSVSLAGVSRAAPHLEEGQRRVRDNFRRMFLAEPVDPLSHADFIPIPKHVSVANVCLHSKDVTLNPLLALQVIGYRALGDRVVGGFLEERTERVEDFSKIATG